MKIKKIISVIIIFSSFLLYLAPAARAEELCTDGKIEYFQYNSSGNVSIRVNEYNLYTSISALKPLLFVAFLLGTTVQIKTSTCHNGGGFSEVAFRRR